LSAGNVKPVTQQKKEDIVMGQQLQHYEASTKTFEQPVGYKVRKLLELGKINKVTDGVYAATPIPGYNITTYTIREHFGRLLCNCQKGRKGGTCAHIEAVRLYRAQTEPKEEQLHLC